MATDVGLRIAQRVTAALEADERTVAWLSRQTGISQSTLRYQLSTGRFPVDSTLKIAGALGLPIEQMVAS